MNTKNTILLKYTLSLILAISFLATGFGQENNVPFSERVFVGGGLGGGISNYYTWVEVSPMVGYMFTDRLAGGIGLRYQYYKDNRTNFSSSIIGPYAYARYQFINFAFAYAEYEHLFLKYKNPLTPETVTNIDVPGFLIGGGLTSGFGRSMVYMLILYNVLESPYTPYSNPVFRMGVSVGI
jgi:hypothetical protein